MMSRSNRTQDSLFEDMPFANFSAAIAPKVPGSWNLHTHLPDNLTFFILLSSVSGIIGATGQSNYAAGNTYQDALARHRVTLGQRAASIDLGLLVYTGYVSKNPKAREVVERMGFPPIDEDEFLALLEVLCDPSLGLLSPMASQILLGLQTPANLRSWGIEEPAWMRKPQFKPLYLMDSPSNVTASAADDTTKPSILLPAAESTVQAAEIISEALIAKLSKVLSVPAEDIDINKPMHVLGVDSLVAVEVRNWFAKDVGAEVKVFEILGNGSIFDMSLKVAREGGFGLGVEGKRGEEV